MFADNNIARPRGNHRLLVSHKATLLGSLYTEYLLEGRRVTYSRLEGMAPSKTARNTLCRVETFLIYSFCATPQLLPIYGGRL